MKRTMPLLWAGTLVFGYLAGYAASPAGSAAARQAAPPDNRVEDEAAADPAQRVRFLRATTRKCNWLRIRVSRSRGRSTT
jgi:hypothetical protein